MAVVSVNCVEFSSKNVSLDDLKSRILCKDEKKNIKIRPKSTPIKLRPDGIDKFCAESRIQTAAPGYRYKLQYEINKNYNREGTSSTCQRSRDVYSQYRLPPTSCRSAARSGRDKLDAVKKSQPTVADRTVCEIYSLGPGYVIYRNGDGVAAEFSIRIDSDEFFGSRKKLERQEATKKFDEDQRNIEIRRLEEQIMNLTVRVEEEKLNHELSKEKWQQQMTETIETQNSRHAKDMKMMRTEKEKRENQLKIQHKNELEELRKELSTEIEEKEKQLDIFKASFESFRQSFIKETTEKIEKQKIELAKAHKVNMENRLSQLKKELTANFEVDLEEERKENAEKEAALIKKYQKEIETLNRRYADAADIEQKLSQTVQELARVRRECTRLADECDELKKSYDKGRKELAVVINESDGLKEELQEFSARFEERVRRVDDSYKQKMDTLQNQIVEIRRAYLNKCEELVKARQENEARLQGRYETATDVMREIITTRHKARVSLVSSTEENPSAEELQRLQQHYQQQQQHLTINLTSGADSGLPASGTGDSRPTSAPITDSDTKCALHKSRIINKDIL